ncbi:helix-turn-helix domain-containing protein [Lachnoclostridium pacaense]|uniref:helix-turn-helix domain-containing protein n=1 Tax=Enterocloster hominis (ex Hitch et al. 2024) TaxID=1917870 RepID=UPI001D107783|nr:helix-turn-helix transcriptional regulator [Lachnoclostridium pacaense]MCC2876073.1 helix-turn-helix domain-containing protein [Lachnoclostridium pacaense]
MQLGQVIRKYRKNKNMTQEEIAGRLGVTAPAVNKWENGASMPDIMLLAPIARLLGITTDILLSFREELTAEEIKALVYEADSMLKEKPYEEAFLWVKKKLEQYPNCEQLILQLAVILDAQRMMQDPVKKMKQAQIYGKTNRISEAYKAYEELLYSHYQLASGVLHGMYMLAMNQGEMDRAHMLVRKQEELARCFEMGKYCEASSRLDIATAEQDADTVIATMKEMLSSIGQIGSFYRSPLYGHMEFKGMRGEFLAELKNNLLKCFRDEESYGFLKEDERWKEIVLQK